MQYVGRLENSKGGFHIFTLTSSPWEKKTLLADKKFIKSFTPVKFSNLSILAQKKTCKSWYFWPKIDNARCFTHLFCLFFCANTASLNSFYENSSLNSANFTDRFFCVNSWKFTRSQIYFTQVPLVPLVTNSMSARLSIKSSGDANGIIRRHGLTVLLWDGSGCRNRWILGKVPKGAGGHFQSKYL